MPYGVPARGMPYGVPARGHDSYEIVDLQGNPLKLLKNTLATKHDRNENHYHLHPQRNICQPPKLSFTAIIRHLQCAAIPSPILP